MVFNTGRPVPAERVFKHHFPNYIPAYFLFNNCNKKGNRPVVILHDNHHYNVVATKYRGSVKGGFRHLHTRITTFRRSIVLLPANDRFQQIEKVTKSFYDSTI